MKIYQQAGHNTNWNIESISADSSDNGIIFSPVHYKKQKVEAVKSEVKRISLFDPQFYVPDSQKSKLHTYDFFPEVITNGFSTIDFESLAHQSAEGCLKFQIDNAFEKIMIPARFYPELVTDYIAKQKAFSVEPFLNEIERVGTEKDIFVSLPVTSSMLIDNGYRTQLLNWITSYPEIDGVYLLNEMSESSKQITDYNKLIAHVDFINELREADLNVIVGYCNTESILLSAVDPYALTIGAYENTRSFSIDKFLDNDSNRRGPAPRIYLPKLLNWMRYDTAVEIKDDFPSLWNDIYTETPYMETIFSTGRPHFTKPELYKHHFKLMMDDLNSLSEMNIDNRITTIQARITNAAQLYTEIKDAGIIFFDKNCAGEHLPIWNRIMRHIR